MPMLVRNATPFPWGRLLASRKPPQREMAVVVRGTFDVVPNEPCRVSTGDPMVQGFVLGETLAEHDDLARAVPLGPNDLVPAKLNAEVIVVGSCTAPQGKPVAELVVEVRVGEWSKGIAVVGRRAYSDRGAGGLASAPQPFATMPIDLRHAYGGPGYAPNPGGAGIASDEAPNLEWPGERLARRGQQPTRGPASLGAVNVRWASRAPRIGRNYGPAWKKERAPFFADDFDWRYFHDAPVDQQLRGYLRGDEPFELVNLHPTLPQVKGQLPGVRPRMFVRYVDGRERDVLLSLDTLVVLADEGRIRLSWRGLVEVSEEDFEDIAAVAIGVEPLGKPLPESHYRSELDRAKEGAIPTAPPEITAKREEAMAQLAAMQEAAEAARKGDKPRGEAIADQLVAALPKGDPRADEVRKQLVAALADHDAHVPPDKQMLDKMAPPPTLAPSPPPIRELTPGDAPKLAPSRKLAKGIDEAIASAKAADEHLVHDPKGDAREKSREMVARLESLKVDPRFGPVFKERVEPGPGRDLSDLDLEGEDLRGANLEGANLEGTILTRADLTGASLRGARLVSAVLFQATLDRADLEGAVLTLANFTEARGEKASFRGVRLDRTFFENALLPGVDFRGARGLGGFFQGTRLEGATFDGADVERSHFEKARLDGASFRDARLQRVSFQECGLASADFDGARLHACSLLRCDAARATFRRASGQLVSFQGSRLDGADLTHSTMPGLMMPGATLIGANLYGADLRGAKARRAVLDGASFERANLVEVDFRRTSCNKTTFRGASLYAAVLLGAAGAGADFAGANLKRCQIEGLT
jgi:uncharacterized protein YjbI with pentapeptide repeats